MRSHPAVMQLQFLPLLYAGPEDRIWVSDLPDNPDPRLCLEPPKGWAIEDWGPSLAIAKWAEEHGMHYTRPHWEQMREINSKVYSFEKGPRLPNSRLLTTQEEVTQWIQETKGPKVLKKPFGTAGNGHLFDPDVKQLYIPPLIGEPWVERLLDFSTQWLNGKLLGVTLFETSAKGTYLRTYAGDVPSWALREHLAIVEPLMQEMGYAGHVGVDAFIYRWNGKERVHPIVEINARKTMSWVALQLPSKSIAYVKGAEGVLPSNVGKMEFVKNITVP